MCVGKFEGADPSSVVALSPDSEVVVVGHHTELYWFNASNGESQGKIEQPHGSRPVTSMIFDKENRWLLTAGDRHIRVFHNVPGHQVRLQDLQGKLKTANTAAMKERLQQQIEELKSVLKNLQQ